MNDKPSLSSVLEALLFASNSPLSTKKLHSILQEDYDLQKGELKKTLESMNEAYLEKGHSFEIKEIAGGYLLQSKAKYEPYLKKLLPTKMVKLAPSALEVLAIIAYKQPITKIEIEKIRGVDSSYSLNQLLERNLVDNQKKLEAPGQPSLYETNARFLEYFGLKNIKELPALEASEKLTTIPKEL